MRITGFPFSSGFCAFALLCSTLGCGGSKPEAAKTEPVSTAVQPVKPPGVDFGILAVDPKNGQGRDQVFRVTLTSAPGAPAPGLIGLLVNNGPSGESGCYAFADTATANMVLVRDSGNGSDAMTGQSIANSQCTLLKADAKVDKAGPLTVSFHLRFKDPFKGAKKLYVIAQSGDGAGRGLEQAGDWLIP